MILNFWFSFLLPIQPARILISVYNFFLLFATPWNSSFGFTLEIYIAFDFVGLLICFSFLSNLKVIHFIPFENCKYKRNQDFYEIFIFRSGLVLKWNFKICANLFFLSRISLGIHRKFNYFRRNFKNILEVPCSTFWKFLSS